MADMTQEEATLLLAEGKARLARIDVPSFNGSNFQAAWVGTVMNIVLTRPHPVSLAEGDGPPTPAAILEPVLSINLSAQSTKDLGSVDEVDSQII